MDKTFVMYILKDAKWSKEIIKGAKARNSNHDNKKSSYNNCNYLLDVTQSLNRCKGFPEKKKI